MVDPSNTGQARSWDGTDGDYWAQHAERFDRSMNGYHRPFLDAAGIEPGSRVLDIGCGSGQTTRDAARLASVGCALGVDLSSQMIDLARRLAAQAALPNVRFERADAQIHPFPAGAFDIAISRTGAMFFGQPEVAFTNIAGSLRSGGRMVLLCWQPAADNEWFSSFFRALTGATELPAPPPGAPGPFSMGDPERVEAVLTTAGFADVHLAARSEPLLFGRDADDAAAFLLGMLGWMLPADEEARQRSMTALRDSLRAHQGGDGVRYGSATWLVTAHRP